MRSARHSHFPTRPDRELVNLMIKIPPPYDGIDGVNYEKKREKENSGMNASLHMDGWHPEYNWHNLHKLECNKYAGGMACVLNVTVGTINT